MQKEKRCPRAARAAARGCADDLESLPTQMHAGLLPGASFMGGRRTAPPHLADWMQIQGGRCSPCPPPHRAPRFAQRCCGSKLRGGFQRRGPQAPLLAALRGSGGEPPKRRRWRMKRGGFEEAARLAGTKCMGIVMPRRWADFGIPPGFSFGGVGKQAKRCRRQNKRACFEEAARLAAAKRLGIVSPRRWANFSLFKRENLPHIFRALYKRTIRHPPARGAYSYISAHRARGSAPHRGWCGCGCLPPPAGGW